MKDKVRKSDLYYMDDEVLKAYSEGFMLSKLLLWLIVIIISILLIWSCWAKLDKITVGVGKVVPSSQVQIIQNLEGGVVNKISVTEGQFIQKGQELVVLDDTKFKADFRERVQQVDNLLIDIVKFSSIIGSVVIKEKYDENDWVSSVKINYEFIHDEINLINIGREEKQRIISEYQQSLNVIKNELGLIEQKVAQKTFELNEVNTRVKSLKKAYNLAVEEYDIAKPLANDGIIPKIEIIKLERQVNDKQREMTSIELSIPSLHSEIKEAILQRVDVAQKFITEQQIKLNEAHNKLSEINESKVALRDRLNRTVVVSPVDGVVKKLYINTIGGVVKPGMDILEIVPTEKNLLIEAKISPKDIAFLRPKLEARVRFSAYDFGKYGGLEGILEYISADTTEDKDGNSHYLVRVRTIKNELDNDASLPIIPGMTATVDIITGERTVLSYFFSPIVETSNNAFKE